MNTANDAAFAAPVALPPPQIHHFITQGAANQQNSTSLVVAIFLGMAVLGNVLIPTLIQILFEPARIVVNNQLSSYEAFSSTMFGLWFSQYMVVWLWVHTHIQNRAVRYFLGAILSATITYLVLYGVVFAWGPGPTTVDVAVLIFLTMSAYFVFGVFLYELIRRTELAWKPPFKGTNGQFSLRSLLAMTAVIALFMLAIILFPVGRYNLMFRDNTFLRLAIWLVGMAVTGSVLLWLLLGSLLTPRPWLFRGILAVVVLTAPLFFQPSAALLWGISLQNILVDRERLMWGYAAEAGMLVGMASFIPLIPRTQPSGLNQSQHPL